MSARFRTPPGWPVPPEDWVPPEGWSPDASWPPAPEGWRFWSDGTDAPPDGATREVPAFGSAPMAEASTTPRGEPLATHSGWGSGRIALASPSTGPLYVTLWSSSPTELEALGHGGARNGYLSVGSDIAGATLVDLPTEREPHPASAWLAVSSLGQWRVGVHAFANTPRCGALPVRGVGPAAFLWDGDPTTATVTMRDYGHNAIATHTRTRPYLTNPLISANGPVLARTVAWNCRGRVVRIRSDGPWAVDRVAPPPPVVREPGLAAAFRRFLG